MWLMLRTCSWAAAVVTGFGTRRYGDATHRAWICYYNHRQSLERKVIECYRIYMPKTAKARISFTLRRSSTASSASATNLRNKHRHQIWQLRLMVSCGWWRLLPVSIHTYSMRRIMTATPRWLRLRILGAQTSQRSLLKAGQISNQKTTEDRPHYIWRHQDVTGFLLSICWSSMALMSIPWTCHIEHLYILPWTLLTKPMSVYCSNLGRTHEYFSH